MATSSFGGPWTEQKLEILRRYLDAYTTALKNQPFQLIYIDAFAGKGTWAHGLEYTSGIYGDFQKLRDGSPRIALGIENKQFDRLVFIEKDSDKANELMALHKDFPGRNIKVIEDDANVALPQLCDGLEGYDRAVVFLDPYATQVSWDTVARLAETKKADCWILFPLMATTRMMPTKREPPKAQAERLDRIFGGREPWRHIYQPSPQLSLIPYEPELQRSPGSDQISDSYRKRLESVFARVVPTAHLLRNSRNSALFDLMFAASNPKGASIAVRIANDIMKNW